MVATAVAGGTAVISTGAFTGTTATRQLSLEVARDNDALLALTELGSGGRSCEDGGKVAFSFSSMSERVRVWLTADFERVTFIARGRPVQSETTALVLDSNESAATGLLVDTEGTTSDFDVEFTVHAEIISTHLESSSTVHAPDGDTNRLADEETNGTGTGNGEGDVADDTDPTIRSVLPTSGTLTSLLRSDQSWVVGTLCVALAILLLKRRVLGAGFE